MNNYATPRRQRLTDCSRIAEAVLWGQAQARGLVPDVG